MNDIVNFRDRLIFKLHILEKPWFYANDKMFASYPLTDSKKFILKKYTGISIVDIAVALNKSHADGQEAFLLVDAKNNCIWKEISSSGIILIKCLIR